MSVPEHIECCVSNKLGQTSLRRCPQYFGCISLLTGTAICCSKQWKDKSSLSSSQMWQLRSEKNACLCLHSNYIRGFDGYRYKSGVWQPPQPDAWPAAHIYICNYRTACSRFCNKVLIPYVAKCLWTIIFANFANGSHLRILLLRTFMFAHTRYIRVCTIITTVMSHYRWRTSMEALCLVKPSSGWSSMGS